MTELKMSLNDLLATTPESLASTQYEALRDSVLSQLDTLKELIIAGDFKGVEDMAQYSPSGDCMGRENYYIEFACGDIGDTCTKLESLAKIAGRKYTSAEWY